MSVHETSDGRWFVAYREPGSQKVHRKYFGRGDVARLQAEAYDTDLKSRRGTLKSFTALSIAELVMLYHQKHHVTESTRKADFYHFKSMLKHIGLINAETLTSSQINDYMEARSKEGVTRRTIHKELTRLKAAYNWASAQEPPVVVRNPLANFKMKVNEARDIPIPPSRDEVQKILACADPHLRRAIILQWYTGMRPGPQEMLALHWHDVDWDHKVIRVVGARKGGPAVRYLPISEDLMTDMQQWHEQDKTDHPGRYQEVCIIHYRGECVASLKRSWATAKKRAGITRTMRPYDLRHAFVSDLLREGADLKTVSELAGHSRPDTTLREYQAVTGEMHRETMKRRKGLVREIK